MRRLIVALFFFATAALAFAQTVTNLHSFTGSDGSNPYGPLVQGQDGSLYGATLGCSSSCQGTVFQITPSGTLKTLHSFTGTDGSSPDGGVTLGLDGRFYGTTSAGGLSSNGTVFSLTANSGFRSLHSFAGADGQTPSAPLLLNAQNHFSSTTQYGGASGLGTVFQIDGAGSVTVLHSFSGSDGETPQDNGLVQGANGAFYGETYIGGANEIGTVYSITATNFRTLYSFVGNGEGAAPLGSLIQATDGNFYGMSNTNVFRITSAGVFTVVYTFGSTDGYPTTGLMQATDGKLYGTTTVGGAHNFGTLFSLTTDGTYTRLFDFDYYNYGAFPNGGALLQHTNGLLYGVTADGGTTGVGTVYSLNVGLAPFVKTVLNFGTVGSQVQILGNRLTGASAVAFGSVPATFTVVSDTYITATVPAGAGTALIHVTTPSGALASSLKFQVR